MGHCDVSSSEFDDLKIRFNRLLLACGLEEVTCPNMQLKQGKTSQPCCNYTCEHCAGLCTVLKAQVGLWKILAPT